MRRFITILSIATILFSILPFTASADTTQTAIHFTIVTNDATLFDGDISVSACVDSETGTSTSVNAFCALEQVASSSGWTLGTTWYAGFGIFLNSINAYAPDATSSRYWGYYSNGDIGMDALNVHQLTPGEHILLTYGINPLRIVPSTTTPLVGTSTLLIGQSFDPIAFAWTLATGTTFMVNGEATSSDEAGNFSLVPSTTTSYVITLSKEGSVTSLPVTLFPYESVATTTDETATSTASTDDASSTPVAGGGSATPDVTHTIDIRKAVEYLRSSANPDGAYAEPLYTDWVAIGLSGAPGADDICGKLRTYVKENTDPGSLLTDLERRAMALEALGIDPSVGTSRDYIKEILTHYDGTQWGDATAINDDIFALIPLLHAGYGVNDNVILQTVATIVASQSSSGSWGSIDLTAAGVEALVPLSSLPGVSDAIAKAKSYLHAVQGDDGGFGSSYATSWVTQAIIALPGEQMSNWMKNGRTPQDYLWLLQQSDGGIDLVSLDQHSRVWATAYAIPAANGKDWNALLGSFPRHSPPQVVQFGSMVDGSMGEVLGTSTLATTTLPAASTTATTTEVRATSTSTIILLPTSTLEIASSTPNSVSSTTTKKSHPLSKKGKVKVTIPPNPSELTSTVAASAIPPSMDAVHSSWTHVIIAPFVRLFHEVRSWFY